VTRRRRPGSFTTRGNDVGPDTDGTLTLGEYRAARGLDPEPARLVDEHQADDEPEADR
jgi:hypothetical protein